MEWLTYLLLWTSPTSRDRGQSFCKIKDLLLALNHKQYAQIWKHTTNLILRRQIPQWCMKNMIWSSSWSTAMCIAYYIKKAIFQQKNFNVSCKKRARYWKGSRGKSTTVMLFCRATILKMWQGLIITNKEPFNSNLTCRQVDKLIFIKVQLINNNSNFFIWALSTLSSKDFHPKNFLSK